MTIQARVTIISKTSFLSAGHCSLPISVRRNNTRIVYNVYDPLTNVVAGLLARGRRERIAIQCTTGIRLTGTRVLLAVVVASVSRPRFAAFEINLRYCYF